MHLYPTPSSPAVRDKTCSSLFTTKLPSLLDTRVDGLNRRRSEPYLTDSATITIYQATNQIVALPAPHSPSIPPTATLIAEYRSTSTGVVQFIGLTRSLLVHYHDANYSPYIETINYLWLSESDMNSGSIAITGQRFPPFLKVWWMLQGCFYYDEGRSRLATRGGNVVNVDIIPAF
ncbi:hypothetical protein AN958_12453 [Leucoagaricus sp. SymC.cos]|nr:hypothetical protein AN958_12453 [Leucoagaricus sp. SymC.cos]